MNIILHGEGKEVRMHQTDCGVFQHTLTVPIKVFLGVKNKWTGPIVADRNLIYKFAYQTGDYYHYNLETHQKN